MRFLNPFGLLGFITLPIIIGLHLHLERNRRVIVSSMFLWSFLDIRFEGEKPKFIRLSWLLLLDLLIAILFSFAFARPQLLLPDLAGSNFDVVILLDDSASMLAQDGEPDRFSLAVEMTKTLVSGAGRDNDMLVATFGGELEVVGSTRVISRQDLLKEIDDLRAGDSGIVLRQGLAAARAFADYENPMRVVVITDGAYPQPKFEDFLFPIHWIFVGFDQNNQAVINPVMEEVDSSTTEIFYQLANFSANAVSREVVLLVNGSEVDRMPVNLPAGSVVPKTVRVSGVLDTVQIYLSGVDGMPLDDLASLGAGNAQKVQVALVTDFPYPLDRAISAHPDAALTVIPPNEFTGSAGYNLVIFREYLPTSMPPGNILIFDPPLVGNSQIPVESINEIGKDISVADHVVLKGINLNAVRWQTFRRVDIFAQTFDLAVSQILAKDESSNLFAMLENPDGNVYLFLPELSGGNFTSHPAFPVLISNLIEVSREIDLPPEYLLGESLRYVDLEGFLPVKLFYPGDTEGVEWIGQSEEKLDRTGLYLMELIDVYGHTRQFTFGVNAGNFAEGNISPRGWSIEYVQTQVAGPTGEQTIEFDLTPWLLGGAMILLLVEAWRAWR